jgi:hypothetical protein
LLVVGRDRGGLEGELAVEHLGLCAAYLVFVEEDVAVASVTPYSMWEHVTSVRSEPIHMPNLRRSLM